MMEDCADRCSGAVALSLCRQSSRCKISDVRVGLSSVGWILGLSALGCAPILAPAAQGIEMGIPPALECMYSKMGAEAVAKSSMLSASYSGNVPAGTIETFSGESKYALTFSVASSPALLSSPDIDSGPGSLQPGTSVYSFTSPKAAAAPRTIYWAASFTLTPEGCEGPSTFLTPVQTLTVVSTPPTDDASNQAQTEATVTGASVKIEKVKVTASNLVITVRAAQQGIVTITGPGLRKTVKTVAQGTDRVIVPLTKAGKAERRQRKKIRLVVSLRTGDNTVSNAEKIKL